MRNNLTTYQIKGLKPLYEKLKWGKTKNPIPQEIEKRVFFNLKAHLTQMSSLVYKNKILRNKCLELFTLQILTFLCQ